MTIRLISLDSHFLIHEGIRSLIAASDQIELVATGTTGAELLPLVAKHQPDIVLLELDLPSGQVVSGHNVDQKQSQRFRAFPAIMELHKTHPATRSVILSRHLNAALAQSALKAGVKGYVLKNDQVTNELITVIHTVYKGGIYLSEPVQNCLMNNGSVKDMDSIALTERQTEVLLAVAENPGQAQKEHARTLMISENTLKQHLREIYRALGVGNLAEALS